MAFKMAEGSLFAFLIRSPWWYSVLIALFFCLVSLLVPSGQIAVLVLACALPFFGIAGYAAYKQSQKPSRKRVQEVADLARQMPSNEIVEKIAKNYTDIRFLASPFKGKVADLELERGNRKLLLSCKRFKAATTGIEPLKQLVAVGENNEATGYLYVALGEVSSNALKYANEHNIELVQAARLAEYFDGRATIE